MEEHESTDTKDSARPPASAIWLQTLGLILFVSLFYVRVWSGIEVPWIFVLVPGAVALGLTSDQVTSIIKVWLGRGGDK